MTKLGFGNVYESKTLSKYNQMIFLTIHWKKFGEFISYYYGKICLLHCLLLALSVFLSLFLAIQCQKQRTYGFFMCACVCENMIFPYVVSILCGFAFSSSDGEVVFFLNIFTGFYSLHCSTGIGNWDDIDV